MILDLYIKAALNEIRCLYIDKDPSIDEYEKFEKHYRGIHLCLDLIDHGKDDFDLKFLADKGLLCPRDFECFGDELSKVGFSTYGEYSQYYQNLYN